MRDFIKHKQFRINGGNCWCIHCGKSWDYGDEDPPSCEPVVEIPSAPNKGSGGRKPVIEINVRKETNSAGPGGTRSSPGEIPLNTHIRRVSINDENHFEYPVFNRGKSYNAERTATALIGFLAAKLACYEPDSEGVKNALEYLKNA